MSAQYTDPRDFILHIQGEIVSEYLKTCHNLDFDKGNNDETREDCADRFIDFINGLSDEEQRNRIFMELEYINSLSSDRHITAICEFHPTKINREADIEEKANNNDERALLMYIKFPDEFDQYYTLANLETMTLKELTLTKTIPCADIVNSSTISDFEKGIQKIYRKSLKGKKCKVKIMQDNDKVLLRAYLEDLLTRDTVFDGDKLDEKHVRKPVFDVVFAYTENLSMLGVRALGGKEIIERLQRLFCSHFLGITEINTEEKRYEIASTTNIMNLELTADASYGVERAYIKSIRLKNTGIPHKLFIDVGGKEQYRGAEGIKQIFEELGLDLNNGWEAESIKITVVFKQIGKGRRKQVTVSITPPNTCNLQNRSQDDVVRKLLKDWGIAVV
jgi:hypothetical protein